MSAVEERHKARQTKLHAELEAAGQERRKLAEATEANNKRLAAAFREVRRGQGISMVKAASLVGLKRPMAYKIMDEHS